MMKIVFSKRGLAALLMFGALATTFVPAAMANGHAHGRRFGPWDQIMQLSSLHDRFASGCDPRRDVRPVSDAGFSWRSGRGDGCAVVSQSHPPHYWYDGRLYCAGQNADGSWRSGVYRCEDDYGRKKVNLVGWDPRCEPRPPCN